MTHIPDSVEKLVQQSLEPGIRVDQTVIYLSSYQAHRYLRYIEGDKHLTVEYGGEYPLESWRILMPAWLRLLLPPKSYSVDLHEPVSVLGQ